MKKILIMSGAVLGSLVCGEALMAILFAFVMVFGLAAGSFMKEPVGQSVPCPAPALSLSSKKLPAPPSR